MEQEDRMIVKRTVKIDVDKFKVGDIIISFLVAVVADVTCHYIIKWLDSDK